MRGPGRSTPAILDVRAPMFEVRAVLATLGATTSESRSIALHLDQHLLLLAEEAPVTTIAVGGARAQEFGAWLAGELGRELPGAECLVFDGPG